MKKLILLFIGSIILFSLWKCVFFPSKDSTSSSENFPIPSSSSDTTSKEPNESDAVLKSSNSMRESLSSSSSTSDEPFSADESNDYKSEELIDTTAQKFFSVPENLAPILKIEDRGIWENYHVLRYTFEFRDAETDAPYCLLQSVELCS